MRRLQRKLLRQRKLLNLLKLLRQRKLLRLKHLPLSIQRLRRVKL
jgi:hypothetical protein